MKTLAKGAVVLLLTVCAALSCAAQVKLRRIEQPAKFVYPNTPIEVGVAINGKDLPSKEVQAGPDWLRNLSLDVKNTSGKDINLLLINVFLKEPKYGAIEAGPETAGIVIAVELAFSEPRITVLPAGDRSTFMLPAKMVDYWTDYARKQGIEDIEKVLLEIRQVGFTDGTGWLLGRQTRKDPVSGRSVFVTENPAPLPLHLPTSLLIPDTNFFLI